MKYVQISLIFTILKKVVHKKVPLITVTEELSNLNALMAASLANTFVMAKKIATEERMKKTVYNM